MAATNWKSMEPAYPSVPTESDYRGFKIAYRPPHWLYSIAPREGHYLVRVLEGQYTTGQLVLNAIDTFFDQNPKATVDDAYEPILEKPKRGRPKKKRKVAATLASIEQVHP